MPAIQPQPDQNIPEQSIQALDAFNNKITVADAELNRLRGLIASEKYTIGELHKEKDVLVKSVENLKKESETAKIELKKVKASIVEAGNLSIKIKEENDKILEKQKIDSEALRDRELSIITKEDEITVKSQELKSREDKISDEEAKIATKKTKLKKVLEEM